MSGFNQDRFEQILQEGYLLNANQCVIDGLGLYRSFFRGFAPYALLLPLLNIVLDLLTFPGLGLLLTSLLIGPVLNAGYFVVANKLIGRQPVSFRDFFSARSHASKLILSNLIYTAIMLVVLLPSYFVLQKAGFLDWYQELLQNPTNPNPPDPPVLPSQASTVIFLNLIPLVYLVVGYIWAYPFILFFGLGPWDALEYSRRLVTRRWGSVFMILMTFFSLFLLASMATTLLRGLGAQAVSLASLAMFLGLPWVYSALHTGFARAAGALMNDIDTPPADAEEDID